MFANDSTLRIRFATSVLLAAPSVAGVIWLPTFGVACVWGVVLGLAAWEWGWLLGGSPRARAGYLLWSALAAAMLLALPWEIRIYWLGLGLPLWLYAAAAVLRYERTGLPPGSRARLAFALLALPLAAAALVSLHERAGASACLALFALVWAGDSFAYLIGKRFGRWRMAPLVSPGKTWEGSLSACLLAPLVAGASAWMLEAPVSAWTPFLLWLAPVTVVGLTGDLYESLVKRVAGTKDSGVLLPGHGGAFDRLDSLIAAAPAFVVLLPFDQLP